MASKFLVMAVALGLAVGCGGEKRPDTGAGADQPVPPTPSCVDLCARGGDCLEVLCNEDSKSSRYTGIGDLFASACEAQCDEALIQSKITSDQWTCSFASSCRQVFDYDSCGIDASYHCT